MGVESGAGNWRVAGRFLLAAVFAYLALSWGSDLCCRALWFPAGGDMLPLPARLRCERVFQEPVAGLLILGSTGLAYVLPMFIVSMTRHRYLRLVMVGVGGFALASMAQNALIVDFAVVATDSPDGPATRAEVYSDSMRVVVALLCGGVLLGYVLREFLSQKLSRQNAEHPILVNDASVND